MCGRLYNVAIETGAPAGAFLLLRTENDVVDQEKIQQAVRLLLEGIGEDATREGLIETPQRVGRMYAEICRGMDEAASAHLSTTFSVESDDMVVERDIQFYSLCEHHLLPFYGKAHVAYIPDGRVTGLSKLARTVEVFARRLQLQERLTSQIADALMEDLGAKGAIVMVEAEHMCMSMRGVGKPHASTATLSKRGLFANDQALVDEFFRLIGK